MKNVLYSIMLVVLFGGLTGLAEEAESVGKVVSLVGEVTAVGQKGTERALVRQSPVFLYDRILTGVGAQVQIMFADETLISQGEQSEMLIDEYVYDPKNNSKDRAFFQFFKGIFRAVTGTITKNNPENFRVKTRKTVIGIRGCELLFKIGPSSEEVFIVDLPAEHSVLITTGSRFRRKHIEIHKQGRIVVIDKRGKMKERDYTPEEKDNVIQQLDVSHVLPDDVAVTESATDTPKTDNPIEDEESTDDEVPKYLRDDAFAGVTIDSKYEPTTKKSATKILNKYKSVPGGVTMEGMGKGLGDVRNVRFRRADNSFVLNGSRAYEIPVTRTEMKEILLAIDQNDKMGVSLAGEQIVYGALDKNHPIASAVRLVDKFLGHIAFGGQENEMFADYKMADGYIPKTYDGPQKSGMCVFFRFGDYVFKKKRNSYVLDSCDVTITLVPTQKDVQADDGGALPDFEAIEENYMPDEWENNVRHISDHIDYYMKERMMRMVNCYGEAAAFSRALKQNGIDLKKLAASM